LLENIKKTMEIKAWLEREEKRREIEKGEEDYLYM
jgi:hypothetical protein